MSFENPTSILFDTAGTELAVSASQALDVSGSNPGIMVAGSSSAGEVRFLHVTDAGDLYTTLGTFGTSADPFIVELTNSAGSPGSSTNPIYITNTSSNPITVSVTSSVSNPVYISGTVNGTFTAAPNTPVSQGNPGAIGDSWNVSITDGTQVLGTGSSAPLWISGSVTADFGSFGSANDPFTVSLSGGLGGSANPIFVSSSLSSPVYVSVSSSNAAPVTVVFSGGLGSPGGTPLSVTGSFTANFDPSTSATVSQVASSATVVTLQAANGNRRALTVYNDGTKNLYLKLGSAASLTSFTVKIGARGYYEVPGNYTGIVTGIWDVASGEAYVTEVLD